MYPYRAVFLKMMAVVFGFGLTGLGVTARAESAPIVEKSNSEILELMVFSDEIMVTTATKRLQKLSEVPGNVTIISEREIMEKGALNLREILLNFTGTEFAHEGLFESVRFRGMQSAYNNKILVLVNGRKVNTIDWGNFNDDFGTNLDNIRQIEIVKGPGSALYGANAFAGVINIITKDGRDIEGLTTKVSFGTKTEDEVPSQYYLMTYGGRSGDWDYVFDASYWRQLGLDLVNVKPNNLFEGNKLELALKCGDDFVFRGGYHKTDESNTGTFFGGTPHDKIFQDIFYADTKYTLPLNEWSKLSVRLEDTYYSRRNIQEADFLIDRTKIDTSADLPGGVSIIVNDEGAVFPAENAVGGYYISFEDALGLISGRAVTRVEYGGPVNELLAECQWDAAWPEGNYLLAGLSFTSDWSGQDYFASKPVSDENYAAYLQDEYHVLDNLILLAGLRYDYNTNYGSNLSPRGSAIYTVLPGLRLKALYGSAFRAPLFTERYIATEVGFVRAYGNSNLKPEQVQQMEAGVEYEFGKWLQTRGGYFYWETSSEIQPVVDHIPVYVYAPDMSVINSGFPAQPGLYFTQQLMDASADIGVSNENSRIGKGFELEATFRPHSYFQVKANYSRFNLYSSTEKASNTVDVGDVELLNGMVGFNYENQYFVNLYGHMCHSPKSVLTNGFNAGVTHDTWLNQCDLSVGGKLRGINLTYTIFNVFESNIAYNQATGGTYVKGPKITRICAEYTRNF